MSIVKIIGYVLALIGIAVLAIGVIAPLRASLAFIPASITNLYFLIGGAIIAIVGVSLTFKSGGSSSQKAAEVPIYHGKEIVGFRRIGK